LDQYREHLCQAAAPTSILIITPDSRYRQVNWYERGAVFFHALENRS
jgi:hypothetical protein